MGRPAELQAEHEAVLVEIEGSNPTATWAEIRAELRRRTELDAHEQTITKSLRRQTPSPA